MDEVFIYVRGRRRCGPSWRVLRVLRAWSAQPHYTRSCTQLQHFHQTMAGIMGVLDVLGGVVEGQATHAPNMLQKSGGMGRGRGDRWVVSPRLIITCQREPREDAKQVDSPAPHDP